MKLKLIIVTTLIIISGIIFYQWTGFVVTETTKIKVVKIVDGDTLEDEEGIIYRLKGVNTPEKSMLYYDEATDFLRRFTGNKTVKVESYGTDQYGRVLTYVFVGNHNVNELILLNGLGTLYYYEEDAYYDKLKEAEESARLSEVRIWKKSDYAPCLDLIELKYEEETKRCSNEEMIKIENSCNKEINVMIKDDATHIYKDTIQPMSFFTKNFSCIWNNDGDSLYAWDEEGLVLFYRY